MKEPKIATSKTAGKPAGTTRAKASGAKPAAKASVGTPPAKPSAKAGSNPPAARAAKPATGRAAATTGKTPAGVPGPHREPRLALPENSVGKHRAKGAARHHAVAELAYVIYVQNGCEDGRDQDHWFAAEAMLDDAP